MVRTIYVVFVENKVYNTSHLKQYMFLCSNDNVKVGTNLKIPVKTIDSSLVNKVKKMISDGNVKYIYSTSAENNNVVNDLIKNYNIENIIINSMYSIDGGITNTNENYFTIMNNNLELFKKELYK